MSADQVRGLIRKHLAGLDESVSGRPSVIEAAIKATLSLYKEAENYPALLTAANRTRLNDRILHAARRAQDLVDYSEQPTTSRTIRNRQQAYRLLFGSIAKAMKITEQELQARCASH